MNNVLIGIATMLVDYDGLSKNHRTCFQSVLITISGYTGASDRLQHGLRGVFLHFYTTSFMDRKVGSNVNVQWLETECRFLS